MFPKQAVGSVVGFGGFAGAMGGFLMNLGAGWFVENQGSYVTMFTIAGFAYLVAIAAIHLLAPRLEPYVADTVNLVGTVDLSLDECFMANTSPSLLGSSR